MSRPNHHPLGIARRVCAGAARIALAISALFALVGAPASAGEQTITPIGQITAGQKGRFVTVQGEIASERSFRAGMRYKLREGDAAITLVLFERVLKQSPGMDSLLPGALVRVKGKVDVYRGEKQVVPVRGSDVTIIKPAPPVPTLNIGDLKPTDEGRLVVLNGQLTAADSFSIGFKFQLSDDSGQIALTLFENVYDGLNQPEQVRVGARVRVTGTVSVYRGALEIVPAASQRLEVLSPPVLPPVEQRALNTISKEDRGKLVRVIASVIRLDKESGEALIKDDTGMQVLRLKGAVAKRVVLKPNDRVEAIGKVRFSRGKQTIDVVLPTDIKVLR